jgi:hypothetical protein
MHAMRLWALASAALLGSSLVICCGDGEDSRRPSAQSGGAGALTPRGGETSGGTGHAGSAESPLGGHAGSLAAGGTSSVPIAGAGDGGDTQLDPEGEELGFCGRLSGISELARKVQASYLTTVYLDCRVTRLVPHVQAPLTELRNEINSWNRRFWGCEDEPVETFPLVTPGVALSQGDADVVITFYVEACQTELALSPLERSEMLAALRRLAKPAIVDPSSELSQSACDAGGAGGAGGASGNATGGAGGAP